MTYPGKWLLSALAGKRIFQIFQGKSPLAPYHEMEEFHISQKNNRTRKYPVQLYLDENELYVLNEKTKAAGMHSRSAFLRQLIVYGIIYEVDYSAIQKNNESLGRIQGSLNQIAKRVNSTGNFYEEDMKEVKELMEKVWHIQESILSGQP